MEIKKNPKANLENQRGVFIQIGLVFAISVSLLAFEWKSYDKSSSDLGTMQFALEDEEMIPITQREIKPPPPPPPPPEIIQIVEDDVEIGLTRSIYHPDLQVRHLYDEQIVLVTDPSHKFALEGEGQASIYDVASQPLILYDKGSSYFVLINRVVREAGIAPNVTMDLDSIEATKKMIERGLGVSFLPRHSVEQELKTGTLKEIEIIEDYNVVLPTSVIVRNSINRSLVVESFLELLYGLYPESLDN